MDGPSPHFGLRAPHLGRDGPPKGLSSQGQRSTLAGLAPERWPRSREGGGVRHHLGLLGSSSIIKMEWIFSRPFKGLVVETRVTNNEQKALTPTTITIAIAIAIAIVKAMQCMQYVQCAFWLISLSL